MSLQVFQMNWQSLLRHHTRRFLSRRRISLVQRSHGTNIADATTVVVVVDVLAVRRYRRVGEILALHRRTNTYRHDDGVATKSSALKKTFQQVQQVFSTEPSVDKLLHSEAERSNEPTQTMQHKSLHRNAYTLICTVSLSSLPSTNRRPARGVWSVLIGRRRTIVCQ